MLLWTLDIERWKSETLNGKCDNQGNMDLGNPLAADVYIETLSRSPIRRELWHDNNQVKQFQFPAPLNTTTQTGIKQSLAI
jgi:hypothetical protein